MNREEIKQYILETYAATSDCPWDKNPNFEVFRNVGSKKWFALFMDIPQRYLGLKSDTISDVMNVKCDPILIGSFCKEKGIFPAYHMNKNHWISVLIDGTVPDERLKMLINISFEATAPKIKRK